MAQPPKPFLFRHNGNIAIRIEPELSFRYQNKFWTISLWNTQKPELKPSVAGTGAYLMRKTLANGKYANHQFGVFDLRKKKIFKSVPNNAPFMLEHELDTIDRLLQRIA